MGLNDAVLLFSRCPGVDVIAHHKGDLIFDSGSLHDALGFKFPVEIVVDVFND
jgi:hypothetical protein